MIGDRIKEIRLKNQLTQKQLGERLGVTRSAVNAWETGISTPNTCYIVAIAKMYKVSTDYLLSISNSEQINIDNLTDEQKKTIYSMLSHFK